MIPIPDVTDVDIAFPASVSHILPAWESIPDEFKHDANPWVKIVSQWFYYGLNSDSEWTPKPGVDARKALRAVQMCLGSFEPQHEHKEAGCAWLLSEWFESVDGLQFGPLKRTSQP